MKGLSFIDKLIFCLNSILAFILLLSYVLPYLPPRHFALLSVLVLSVPFLIIANALFVIYWTLKFKKQFLLSLIILGLGYTYILSFLNFNNSENFSSKGISIMSYNVRNFNHSTPSKTSKELNNDALEFITSQNLDLLCMQEYPKINHIENHFEGYFSAVKQKSKTGFTKSGLAIFSKYEIIDSGTIDFESTGNNAMFADLMIKKDTVRVYNIHLQSLSIDSDIEKLKEQDSKGLIKHIAGLFSKQQDQMDLIVAHQKQSPYPFIVTGDFNNTSYSYVYRKIRGDLIDCFVSAGNGFGKTFNFKFFPLRIDFILSDPNYDVLSFTTFEKEYSDHFPVKAVLDLH